jgi:hypothetical protein
MIGCRAEADDTEVMKGNADVAALNACVVKPAMVNVLSASRSVKQISMTADGNVPLDSPFQCHLKV